MNYRFIIKNQFLKIITPKSILNFLEDNEIKASEGKLLNGEYETIIRLPTYGRQNIAMKIRNLMEAL